MADQDRVIQKEKIQREVSEEEQRRLNIHLRGGKNVDEQEDERGILGASPEQGGRFQGEMADAQATERERKGEAANPQGRRGGQTHH